MLRVLAFTDPHGEIAAAEAIVNKAAKKKPNCVVCAGDLSFFAKENSAFIEELATVGVPIYCIPGNHDSKGYMLWLRRFYPFIVDVSFRVVETDKAVIVGVPGNDLAFWPGESLMEEETFELTMNLCGSGNRGKRLILLAHYPPSGTAIDGRRHPIPDAGGSRLVRRIVEALRPDLCVCGHYHQACGKKDRIRATMVVNPGPRGMIVNFPVGDTT